MRRRGEEKDLIMWWVWGVSESWSKGGVVLGRGSEVGLIGLGPPPT